jgi:ATP-dependent RNA helicase DDX58
MNSFREKLLTEAIDKIVRMDQEQYDRMLTEEQKIQTEKRRRVRAKRRALKKEREQLREQGRDYHLACIKCAAPATNSIAIRVIECAHHVVIDKEFKQKIDIKPVPDKKKYAGWEKTGRVHCKNCDERWGSRCRYSNKDYTVLQIEHFKIIDPYDKVIPRIKKWKDCPFYIEPYQPYENDESAPSDTNDDDS